MFTKKDESLNNLGKLYTELTKCKVTLSPANDDVIERATFVLLCDLHKWEKTDFTPEEITRVKRDLTLRIEQILPVVLINEKYFTKDMLAVANKPLPLATLWQKIKFCYTLFFS